MDNGEVDVMWEYFPKPVRGTVGDPRECHATATSLACVVRMVECLKRDHGDNLIYVDILIRLFGH